MKLDKILGIIATVVLALGLGVGLASATMSNGGRSDHSATKAIQAGHVDNGTEQHAKSSSDTGQKNFNAPFGVHSGDVGQSNWADTNATSKNSNDTSQSLNQREDVKNEDHGKKHEPKHHECGCQDEGKGYGKDGNGYKSPHGSVKSSTDAKQFGSVSNYTDQGAASKAETTQYNINVPVVVGSPGSGNGSVDQSNKADTNATSKNANSADQSLNQDQSVNGGKSNTSAEQEGLVQNGTDQAAQSKAETTQYNINVPISIFSPGSNNGSVSQSNGASTHSTSANSNSTTQSLNQMQQAA